MKQPATSLPTAAHRKPYKPVGDLIYAYCVLRWSYDVNGHQWLKYKIKAQELYVVWEPLSPDWAPCYEIGATELSYSIVILQMQNKER